MKLNSFLVLFLMGSPLSAMAAPAATGAVVAGPVAAGETQVIAEKVWISRPDGSASCQAGTGHSLEFGAYVLKKAGIEVFDQRKSHDAAILYIQECGAPTGTMNSYQISRKDLGSAESLGFHEDKRIDQPFPSIEQRPSK